MTQIRVATVRSALEALARCLARRPALPLLALLLAGLASLWAGDAHAQCAMCRTAFDSPEGRRLIAAYRAGIALLLATPAAAFGTVVWLAVRGRKRLEAAENQSGPD